jgi:hypothetical protein
VIVLHWLFHDLDVLKPAFSPEFKSYLIGVLASLTTALIIQYFIRPAPSSRVARKF